ncbi:MAG: hypothetical protein ACYCOR_07655 [Acidobacteriaceae bacterium]
MGEVKNPDDIRIVKAAITLWILRCAKNDSSRFDRNICKSAISAASKTAWLPAMLFCLRDT